MSSKNLDFGEYIHFDTKKRFGIITLNRVHRSNAFTIEQLKFLKKAIEHCQNTKKIRGLILTAAGTLISNFSPLKSGTFLISRSKRSIKTSPFLIM